MARDLTNHFVHKWAQLIFLPDSKNRKFSGDFASIYERRRFMRDTLSAFAEFTHRMLHL